jgi:hypothetical protein
MTPYLSAWFVKYAKKSHITSAMLCEAVVELSQGLADDLGGGVYKKRLKNNEHRAIILIVCRGNVIFEFGFAKSNRANIDAGELANFKRLSQIYQRLSQQQLQQLCANGALQELICPL